VPVLTSMADIRIRLPSSIHAGEVVEVTTLAMAPPLTNADAEFDASGVPVPHYVGFEAEFEGRPLLRCVLGPGVSRHVMVGVSFKPDRSGHLTLRWLLREGGVETRQVAITLS